MTTLDQVSPDWCPNLKPPSSVYPSLQPLSSFRLSLKPLNSICLKLEFPSSVSHSFKQLSFFSPGLETSCSLCLILDQRSSPSQSGAVELPRFQSETAEFPLSELGITKLLPYQSGGVELSSLSLELPSSLSPLNSRAASNH